MKSINNLNNLEKKNQHNMIVFLIGLVLGIAATFLLSSNKTMRQHLFIASGLYTTRLKIARISNFEFGLYAVVAVLAISILCLVVRFFSSSKSLPVANFVLRLLIGAIIGIPFTAFLFVRFDKYVQKFSPDTALMVAFYMISLLIFIFFSSFRKLSAGFRDLVIQVAAETFLVKHFHLGRMLKQYYGSAVMNVRIVILTIFFAICFTLLAGFLGDLFSDILRMPLKRCKLEVYQVINTSDYGVNKLLLKSRTFADCFNAMKINGDSLWPNQFFRITELSFIGTEVTHWNYFATGEVIRMTKEELCKSFMNTMKDASGSAVIPN